MKTTTKMKIRISEMESYDIKMNEELQPKEFLGLMDRLRVIEKLLAKDVFFKEEMGIENSQPGKLMKQIEKRNKVGRYEPKEVYVIRKQLLERLKTDRELVKKIYFLYYNTKGKDSELISGLAQLGLGDAKLNKIVLSTPSWKDHLKLHGIRPEEVGLVRFPAQGGGLPIKIKKQNEPTINATAI